MPYKVLLLLFIFSSIGCVQGDPQIKSFVHHWLTDDTQQNFCTSKYIDYNYHCDLVSSEFLEGDFQSIVEPFIDNYVITAINDHTSILGPRIAVGIHSVLKTESHVTRIFLDFERRNDSLVLHRLVFM